MVWLTCLACCPDWAYCKTWQVCVPGRRWHSDSQWGAFLWTFKGTSVCTLCQPAHSSVQSAYWSRSCQFRLHKSLSHSSWMKLDDDCLRNARQSNSMGRNLQAMVWCWCQLTRCRQPHLLQWVLLTACGQALAEEHVDPAVDLDSTSWRDRILDNLFGPLVLFYPEICSIHS